MLAGSRFLVRAVGTPEIADRVVGGDRLTSVTPESIEDVVLHLAVVEVPVVDVGDLELATPRYLQLGQDSPDGLVVEIHARYREVAGRLFRFLDDPGDPVVAIELSYTQVAEVRPVALPGEHDPRPALLLAER